MKINNLLSLLNNNTAFLFTSTQKNVIMQWIFKNKKQFLNSPLLLVFGHELDRKQIICREASCEKEQARQACRQTV